MLVAACTLLIYAGWIDLRSSRIPNWVPLTVAGLFPIFGLHAGLSLQAVCTGHVAAGMLILLLGLLFFAMRMVRGGDVKLLAAVSVWFGWGTLVPALFVIAIIGAGICVLLLAVRESAIPLWLASGGFYSRVLEKGRGAPNAIAIAGGFLLVELL